MVKDKSDRPASKSASLSKTRKRPISLGNKRVSKSPSDIISFSLAEGVYGPRDLLPRDGPNHSQFSPDLGRKSKNPKKAPRASMDCVDKEITEYLRGGGTIKFCRGFTKTFPIFLPRKIRKRSM